VLRRSLCFFFQAEDGIRDIGVTGVQTCALPIFCLTAVDDSGFEHLTGLTKMKRMVVCSSKVTGTGFRHLEGMKQLESIHLHSSRSEEGRVGKECRCGWSAHR